MYFIDASIRVRHECPFCDFSALFPEAHMALWCNRVNEVLQITAPSPGSLRAILEAAEEYLNAKHMFRDTKSALSIVRDCRCTEMSSVTSIADESGCWLVPPTTYSDGWETHRVFSPGKESLNRMVSKIRKIGEIRLLSKHLRRQLDIVHELGIIPVHFFKGMTDKQIHALVVAYENGLFDLPTRAKYSEVAEKEGVSRSTFGEHLRKAQMKILRNSYPLLKLMDLG